MAINPTVQELLRAAFRNAVEKLIICVLDEEPRGSKAKIILVADGPDKLPGSSLIMGLLAIEGLSNK